MIRICKRYEKHMRREFRDSFLQGYTAAYQKSTLRLLSPHGTNERAWHAKCKSACIYYCEYTHPDMLSRSVTYNLLIMETINNFWKRSGRQLQQMSTQDLLHQRTEGYFNAVGYIWQQVMCQDPSTQAYICLDQRPLISIMNRMILCWCSLERNA